jgi:hypothetical protein
MMKQKAKLNQNQSKQEKQEKQEKEKRPFYEGI